MSYARAGMGDATVDLMVSLGVPAASGAVSNVIQVGGQYVTQAMANAKTAAAQYIGGLGLTSDAFDAFDGLCKQGYGVVQDIQAGKYAWVSDLSNFSSMTATKGIQMAASLVNQFGGAGALESATGLPPGTVALVLGLATGQVNVGQICQVAGMAVGTGICGPLCGAAGALIGTLVGEAVQHVATDIVHLFGGTTSADAQKILQDRLNEVDILKIQFDLMSFTNMQMYGVQFGIAQTYNKLLNLGIAEPPSNLCDYVLQGQAYPPWFAGGPPYNGQRALYVQANGGRLPEEVVLTPAREAFIISVAGKVNQAYSNLWVRGAVESGWAEGVQKHIYPGPPTVPTDADRMLLTPAPGQANPTVWCQWSDVYPPCATFGTPLGDMASDMATKAAQDACNSTNARLAMWRCHNQPTRYRQWLTDATNNFGKLWTAAAARDCGLILLKQKSDAQAASIAVANQLAASATSKAAASASAAALAAVTSAWQAQVNQDIADSQSVSARMAQAQAWLTGGGISSPLVALLISGLGIGAAAWLALRPET